MKKKKKMTVKVRNKGPSMVVDDKKNTMDFRQDSLDKAIHMKSLYYLYVNIDF